MKRTLLLLCSLSLFACSGGSNSDNGDGGPQGVLRSKMPEPGPNVASTPRFHPTCQMRQHDATLRSAQTKLPWELHGRLREVSSLSPADFVDSTGFSTRRRALAIRLPLSPSAYEPGCSDGSREGFLSLPHYPDIAACAGGDMGLTHIDSPEANAHCAPGWHVCSPARDAADAAIVGSITYEEAILPEDCFAYNAAQNGNSCIPCTGDPGARQMAGVGKDCIGGTYDPNGSGCTADGRLDSYNAEGTMGLACGGTLADGVVCCNSQSGSGSTPADCPMSAPGQRDVRSVNNCQDTCVVRPSSCNQQVWPDGYPVHCSRDGFEWACLEGATCDMTTPIDFYVMLYTPDVYCIFDPDPCPAEFPDLCGTVCCRFGATCLADAYCMNACPPDFPAECRADGLFSGCCVEDRDCGWGCSCPSGTRGCFGNCCSGDHFCRDGACYSSSCDPDSDHPHRCADHCCQYMADCLVPTPPGTCGCPPDLPQECGDFCCSSGSTCDNGTCTPPCGGDYTVECQTADGDLLCCLDGATCEADGCSCPPDLPVECDQWCAEAGSQYITGGCFIPECGYGLLCGELCCDGVDCIQPGECGCPEGYPVPCGDMCCLDNCSCDPLDCTNGCSGDFPDYCATGWSGPECCRAGAECSAPGGCACPGDYPVYCDQYCCPDRTRCNNDDCLPYSCPADYPVDCGDFTCCPEDTECLPGDLCSCPDDYPVECDFLCCPQGWICGQPDPTGIRYCEKPPDPNGEKCPGGWKGSTRSYGAVGMSDPCRYVGELDVCITKEMYEQGTGLPFPPSCAPDGTTGCINNAGVLVKPCCPGLTCRYRDDCGGPGNGQCKQ